MQIADFVNTLFAPDDIVLVRFIESWEENGKKAKDLEPITQHFKPHDLLENWASVLHTAEKRRKNVFFGVCPRVQAGADKAEHIATVRALWADIDYKDKATSFSTVAEVLDHVATSGLPKPSIVISSGHGAHCYWLLSEPVTMTTAEQRAHIKSILASIADRLQSDHTIDVSRILRLPDTLNRKNERNGTTPTPCTVVELDGARRYPLSVFEALKPKQLEDEDDGDVWANIPALPVKPQATGDRFADLLNAASLATVGTRSEADFALIAYAVENGMAEADVWSKVQNVGKFQERGEAYFNATWEAAQKRTTDKASRQESDSADIPEYASIMAMTDLGNARLALDHYGANLRYVTNWRRWIHWTGVYWQPVDSATIEKKYIHPLVSKIMPGMAGKIRDDDRRKKWLSWCVQSNGNQRIRAAVERLGVELSVDVEQLNQNPGLFACRNAILDLTTGQKIEPRREDYITQVANVTFDETADCPTFKRFIGEILVNEDGSPNPEYVDYMQRVCGYLLTADTSEQTMFVLWGAQKNGKSTLTELLADVLGDYAIAGDSSLYFASKDTGNSEDIARLYGRRFVATVETQQGRAFTEAKVKQLTGSDRLTASRKYEHTFEFSPSHKLWLACNYKPRISVDDPAMLRRIKLCPFHYVVPEEKRDAKLGEKLRAEKSGIINWMLAGLKRWQAGERLADDARTPAIMRAAKDSYIEENDTLGEFVEETTETAGGARLDKGVLYARYNAWAKEHGQYALSARNFSMRLVGKGWGEMKSNGKAYWRNVHLREETFSLRPTGKANNSTDTWA